VVRPNEVFGTLMTKALAVRSWTRSPSHPPVRANLGKSLRSPSLSAVHGRNQGLDRRPLGRAVDPTGVPPRPASKARGASILLTARLRADARFPRFMAGPRIFALRDEFRTY
jgi:hypothetical protein